MIKPENILYIFLLTTTFYQSLKSQEVISKADSSIMSFKKDIHFFSNDSLNLIKTYYNNGNLKELYTKCASCGSKKGLYVCFYLLGIVKEIGIYKPINCTCNSKNIRLVSLGSNSGIFLNSQKNGVWRKYSKEGKLIKSLDFGMCNDRLTNKKLLNQEQF